MNHTLYTHLYPTGQKLELVQGDITQENVDAIVNAANAQLAHGGGVAAIIARRGGSQVNAESRAWVRKHGPVSHAEPAYTTGGNLPCRYIIHAVGPVWGSGREDEKLAAAIIGSLRRANELGLRTISFPAISTGIFGFPKKRAARLIYRAVQTYFEIGAATSLELVRLTLYDAPTLDAFVKVFNAGWSEEPTKR